MNNLFQLNQFRLHSGIESKWKIDCDSLTTDDWQTLAVMAVELILPAFDEVVGVPEGGLAFEAALKEFLSPGANQRIICDDVLTTGGSIREWKRASRDLGVVVFARGYCPHWVSPIFKGGWL